MSSFLDENRELPSALESMVRYYRGEGRERLLAFRALCAGRRGILFCGMGTSEFTPLLIQWRLRRLGVACTALDAGEWHYYGEPVGDEQLVVLTSQSGESIELRNMVSRHLRGRPYVAISNDEASSLCRGATLTLPLRAGGERSITTKTYTNNLALLYLVAAAVQGPAELPSAAAQVEACIAPMGRIAEGAVTQAAEALATADSVAFVGRGAAYVSARQCALTFMEGARTMTSSFTGGAFNHGPMEAVDKAFAIVVLCPSGATHELSRKLAERAAARGASVVALTTEANGFGPGVSPVAVPCAARGSPEDLFPVLAAGTHNLLLERLAHLRGIEAGSFRYGSKVTGEE